MSDPNKAAEKARRKEAAEAKYQRDVAGLTFVPWGKISRLNREIVITEKLDGTNAAIGITEPTTLTNALGTPGGILPSRVYAQSRGRIITPEQDNYGFAAWVAQHSELLAKYLGPGLHFGEWWGVSIARGYGLSERRFSLFNTQRWGEQNDEGSLALANLRLNGVSVHVVPVLYTGPWMIDNDLMFDFAPNAVLNDLRVEGSRAVPGFMRPEGICVYHKASQQIFKATVENDEEYKGPKNTSPEEPLTF